MKSVCHICRWRHSINYCQQNQSERYCNVQESVASTSGRARFSQFTGGPYNTPNQRRPQLVWRKPLSLSLSLSLSDSFLGGAARGSVELILTVMNSVTKSVPYPIVVLLFCVCKIMSTLQCKMLSQFVRSGYLKYIVRQNETLSDMFQLLALNWTSIIILQKSTLSQRDTPPRNWPRRAVQ